jgi:hypothetical protein
MSRVALLLSFVAVALSAWAAFRPAPAAAPAAPAETGASAEALAALEARLARMENAPHPIPAPAPAPAGGATLAGAPTNPGATGGGASPATTEGGRPAPDVESRLAALEKKTVNLGENGEFAAGMRARQWLSTAGSSFFRTMDDAQRELELTPNQRADFDRITADSKRELEELRKTPDESGKTWSDVQREMFLGDGTSGGIRIDASKMMTFRNQTIPGRSETYAAADERIRTDAKRRLRDTLTPAQQEKYDKSNVDPLIGPGMGGFLDRSVFFAPAEPARPGGR